MHVDSRIMLICHSEGNAVLVHAVLHNTVYNIYVPYCFIVQTLLSLSYRPHQPERKRSSKDSDGLNNSGVHFVKNPQPYGEDAFIID